MVARIVLAGLVPASGPSALAGADWTFECAAPGWTLIPADARMIAETVRDPERALPVPARVFPVPGGEPARWVVFPPAVLPVEELVFDGDPAFRPPAVLAWIGRGWRSVAWRRVPPADGDVRLALLDRAAPSPPAGPAFAVTLPDARVDPGSRRTPPPAHPKGLALFAALVVVGAVAAWIVRCNLPARSG